VIDVSSLGLAVGLAVAPLAAAGVVLARTSRLAIAMLLATYVSAGLVVGAGLGPRIGLGLGLVGVVCCVILAAGVGSGEWSPIGPDSIPQGRAFRVAAVLLVGAASWGLAAPGAAAALPVSDTHLASAAIVVAMGLLIVGLSQDKQSAALGILATVAGFEMVYAYLEPSLAMRAVLAAVTVGVALAVSIDPESRMTPPGAERRVP
jgi:hypothetical protein